MFADNVYSTRRRDNPLRLTAISLGKLFGNGLSKFGE